MVETILLISICSFMQISSVAAAGFAPVRPCRPHQRWKSGSLAREGANLCALRPLPHDCSVYLKNSASSSSVGMNDEKRA
jgi:hypothetical protein